MTDKSNTQAALLGHGLTNEQADLLLVSSLKPEEIGGAPDLQHRRVRELLHWFARLTQGNANPKWLRGHAFELAYYVATMGPDRSLDVDAIHKAGFLEGVNISPEDRRMLERVGSIAAQPTPEPSFAGIAARKLADLQSQGYEVNGYSIQHAETKQRGFITTGGFVGWWVSKDHVQPTPGPVAEGLVVVDMVPPATARDRWMYEQGRLAERDARWKVGNEFAPFHKSASHVNPDYRDGWNACYEAARASLPAGFTPEQVAELVAARDKILAASLPAGGVVLYVSPQQLRGAMDGTLPGLPGLDETRGVYLPVRTTPGGLFTQPLYATPQPSETQGRRQMTASREEKVRQLFDQIQGHYNRESVGFHCIEEVKELLGIPASPQDGGVEA